MGMIRAAGLGYEYLRYEEEGQEPEVTKAIEDVSLEIQKGQFIAVLGHNGSGKSTLAKHINALLVPTEGTSRALISFASVDFPLPLCPSTAIN